MKRLLIPVFLLLSACSTTSHRSLPPVVDGHSGETLPEPRGEPGVDSDAPPPVVYQQKPPGSGGAVIALLGQADRYHASGDSGNEAATIERALRIEPRNARLWSRLAAVRLQQGRPQQAEQLALKSNALAADAPALQAANWRLVARARWSMNDADGARQAEQRAVQSGG